MNKNFIILGIVVLLFAVGLSGCNEQTGNYQTNKPEPKFIGVTDTYYGTTKIEIITEGFDRYEIHDIKIGDSIYSIYVDSDDYYNPDSTYYVLIGLDIHHVGKTIIFRLEKYHEWYLLSSYEVLD